MTKSIHLAVALSMCVIAAGCSEAESSLITPDADFYEKGIEAEKNGLPPGTPGPQTGKFKALPPTPAS